MTRAALLQFMQDHALAAQASISSSDGPQAAVVSEATGPRLFTKATKTRRHKAR